MRESARPLSEETTSSAIPFVDGPACNRAIAEEVFSAVTRIFTEPDFVPGGEVAALEKAVAEYCDSRYAVGCASGADALTLALMALDVRPGDEVITSPFAHFATVGAICRLGARAVFADIDPVSFTLNAEKVEDCITPRTRAIVPVHLFGQCAEMEPLFRMAVQKRLAIVEDAWQSLGAEYRGRRAGVLGTLGCFHFVPLEISGGGGLITTDDGELAARLRRLRVQGDAGDGTHLEFGLDSQLGAVQAAVLHIALKHLEKWTCDRQTNARRYRELFRHYELLDVVELPESLPDRRHVFHQFCVRIRGGQRDTVRNHLRKRGIGAAVFHAVPLHLQPACAMLGYSPGDFPEAEQAAAEHLALPIDPPLQATQQETVVRELAAALGRAETASLRNVTGTQPFPFPPRRAA